MESSRFPRFRRFLIERGYRSHLRGLNSPKGDKSNRSVSFGDEVKIEYLRILLNRAYQGDVFKTTFFFLLPSRFGRHVNNLCSIFKGSLSSDYPGGRIRFKMVKFKSALREILSSKIRGKFAYLLPSEVVPFVDFPKKMPGIAFRDVPDLSVPKFDVSDGVFIGNVVRRGVETDLRFSIPLDSLRKHVGIFGLTGFGKTNTCMNILIQLYERFKVPFIIIAPVKKEYRVLSRVVPDLKIFTVGNENVSPLRLNLFSVPDGVNVLTHIDGLKASFNASFILYAPMPYVLEQCLLNVYEKNGWDFKTSKRGRTPTLIDLYNEVENYTPKLGYDKELTLNVKAALKTRLKSLMIGSKGSMFLTKDDSILKELFRTPMYFELDHIEDEGEKTFIMGILLSLIYEKLKALGETDKIRVIIVVEEAHRVLQDTSNISPSIESADTIKWSVRYFANMLSEIRAFGGGIIVIEQIPSKLVSDVVKGTGTKIIHRILAKDDKEILGSTTRLDEENQEKLTGLDVGKAFIFTERFPYPVALKVPRVDKIYGFNITPINDEEVRKIMGIPDEDKTPNYIEVIDRSFDTVLGPICPKMPPDERLKIFAREVEKIFSNREFVEKLAGLYRRTYSTSKPSDFADLLFDPSVKAVGYIHVGKFAYMVLKRSTDFIDMDIKFFTSAKGRIEIRSKETKANYYKKAAARLIKDQRFEEILRNLLNVKGEKETLNLLIDKLTMYVFQDDATTFAQLLLKMIREKT